MKKLILGLLTLGLFACASEESTDNSSDNSKNAFEAFSLSNLDTTASPCENFYQYAVGGWLKDNPIPSTESRWSSFNVVNDSNNLKLRNILDEFSAGDFEKGSMEQQLGDFYAAALDSAHCDELGVKPLEAEMQKIDAIDSKDALIKVLAEQKAIGVNSLFGIYIGQDDKNSEQYITHVYQSGLGLPDRDYYLKSDEKSTEIQEGYKAYMIKVLGMAGMTETEALTNEIYGIENYLASKSMSREDRRIPENTYNKFMYDELEKSVSNLNWSEFFSTVGLSDVDNVIVGQPDFFYAVNKAIDSISLDSWKIYMKWRLLDSYASSLSSDFVNASFEFYGKTLSGSKELKPRWKRALSMVNGNAGQLLGKAFVKEHFSEEAKAEVGQMVENLRAVFKERIMALEWMSDETKEKALEKLASFNKKIGYPDKWRSYEGLEVSSDNLVQNLMNAKRFNFAYSMNKLGKPVDKDEWFMSPQTVNAYYSSSKNEIVFPAGILQAPFYSYEADDAINYGGIGAVIGHEFTHGFDDQGSKYDANGNLKNWWTEDDRSRFEKRANLVVEQFNGYEPLDSLFVNGKLTLGENIADLGGATLAYYALLKEVEGNEPEDIDGFNYKQRFFLGWAQVWHMNMTDEELRKRVATDPHSPGNYRVIGPLSNMNEFAEAFGCVQGDQMVQADSVKAVIW
ncbi:MAG: endothelin-converting protein [Flavobacteriales bacterium]|nr:endothelin-converting protein [Flavobacteriales bacterium]